MANIMESASIEDIALYLQREDGIDAESAQNAAQQVIDGFIDMRDKGLIKGWYFDELGHLELLPTDTALSIIERQK
ncbi:MULTISPECIES: hypothetical protein [unclassified Photobacterium]|uniref:hypothetical protein n=1 Tax=unclassified Photobacterium TaxID=2628852 RepID=UPI000D166667|nr:MULTISPECIES: hypothetical protein [unclassified Photobacterium]PSV28131.1 hypothetical protein C9J42_02905 [Photobacterium sp. GB-56]PSV32397.1 hypothetical protein C9J40_04270 [Photobacterium sp. GB-72]PSV38903.1 hypothetical protein C9J44_03675 [Photobacterium sp. GB-27]PSV39918.1 hypothetical protein C9J38_05165 [Photobacterium sp. GB-210]PSV47056.1 hypothetical protein C9J46_02115 [Photobacterium sp. GB-36]